MDPHPSFSEIRRANSNDDTSAIRVVCGWALVRLSGTLEREDFAHRPHTSEGAEAERIPGQTPARYGSSAATGIRPAVNSSPAVADALSRAELSAMQPVFQRTSRGCAQF